MAAMENDLKLWTALVTALLALAGTLLTAVLASRDRRDLETLKDDLQSRREQRVAAASAEQVLARYRDPLLHAAYDLQSRCWNIVEQGFLTHYLRNGSPRERDYAIENTVFLFAQYLGWTELIRQEVQFLDLGKDDKTRALRTRQDEIYSILQTYERGPRLRLFAGDQRAIGELMIERPPGMTPRCLGYATFRLQRPPSIDAWLDPLREDLLALSATDPLEKDRLVALQGSLVELLDLLDPLKVRFPVGSRSSLSKPVTADAKSGAPRRTTAPSSPA